MYGILRNYYIQYTNQLLIKYKKVENNLSVIKNAILDSYNFKKLNSRYKNQLEHKQIKFVK